jgi:hypothetical protein
MLMTMRSFESGLLKLAFEENHMQDAINKTLGTKLTPRQAAAVKLRSVYVNLAPSGRNQLQEVLLRHMYLINGTNAYLSWKKWNELDRRTTYLDLSEHVSPVAANAWFDWAFWVAAAMPTASDCRTIIGDFVKQLVILRFMEEPLPSGGHVKKTSAKQKRGARR